MTDEEKNESTDQEEPQAEADAAPAEEPVAEADAAPAKEPAAEVPAEPGEDLPWKERRRLERSRRPHEPHPQRTPQERAAQQREARRAKAVARRRYRQSKRSRGEPGSGTPPAERSGNPPKVRQGVVVSDKADKTITVRIDIVRRHPAYEKIVRRSRTLHAHDEGNEAGAGDIVRVVETRPLSRTKRWRLLEVIEKAR
jgi:small subunit ribosomal protein S17